MCIPLARVRASGMRYLVPIVLPFVAAICLIGSVFSARAADTLALTLLPTGGIVTGGTVTTASPTDFQRLLTHNTGTGSSDFTDLVKKARVGQAEVDMTLKRTLPWAGAKTAAAAAVRFLPYASAGYAVWDLYNQLGCRPDGNGMIKCDNGQNEETTSAWCNRQSSTLIAGQCGYSTPEFAVQAQALKYPATACKFRATKDAAAYGSLTGTGATLRPYVIKTMRTSYASNSDCTGPGTTAEITLEENTTYVNGTTTQCPAVIDALNPAYNLPAGSPKRPDGKCPTGQYTQNVTDAEAAAKPDSSAQKLNIASIVQGILNAGRDLAPYMDPKDGTLTGPSPVAQPGTTTTTTPGGGGAPVTTTTTPQQGVVYEGNRYTITNTTTTTTTVGGDTTTTVSPPPEKVITCGLPDTPKCKIDETGTPTTVGPPTGLDTAATAVKDAVTGITAPALSWTLGLSIPAGACDALTYSGGGSRTFTVPICTNSAVLMTRTLMSWLLGMLTALYCWRSLASFLREN